MPHAYNPVQSLLFQDAEWIVVLCTAQTHPKSTGTSCKWSWPRFNPPFSDHRGVKVSKKCQWPKPFKSDDGFQQVVAMYVWLLKAY